MLKSITADYSLYRPHDLVRYTSEPLHGAISQTTGLAIALTAQTQADRTLSERYLAEAANLTSTKEHDHYQVRFNYGRYLLELGDTQIVLRRPGAALETLEEADRLIGLDQQQRKGYISILRAEALTSLKQPRWDIATDQLMQAFELSAPIESAYNMDYIGRIMKRIQNSPYVNAVSVVQLRMATQNWRQTQVV